MTTHLRDDRPQTTSGSAVGLSDSVELSDSMEPSDSAEPIEVAERDVTTDPAALVPPTAPAPAIDPTARAGTRLPLRRRVRILIVAMHLRWADLRWLVPVLIAGMVVNVVGRFRFPQFVDDEGTYTAQAYAVERLGELTHYTYWYDHPPLGWLQIAGWTSATGALNRYEYAVMAGREAMMLALVVAAVLLWSLTRRLGLPRVVAGGAIALFTLAPLAVQFHRTVYLDNIAVVWVLLAFLLATVRSHQLAAYLGAAFAAAVAVLTKETFLLLVPFLAWMMWRNAVRPIRRYTLSASAAVFVLMGVGYLAFALVKGELMPGPGRVSLWDGIAFQLVERESSGSIVDAEGLVRQSTDVWWQLSPFFLTAAAVAMIAGLASKRLRPFAAALILMVLMIVRPGGYVPVPHIIAMLPLMALLVPAVAYLAWRRLPAAVLRRRGPRVSVVALTVLALAATAGPHVVAQWRGQLLSDANAPLRQAQEWLETNVARDHRLIVDDVMWVDLVEAGFERENVIWYYKADTDPAVMALSPNGWRDADYVVTTDSMLSIPGAFPEVEQAITHSTVTAAFGAGDERVEIRRVRPEGIDAADADDAVAGEARARIGTELLQNPGIEFGADADPVADGMLDPRLLVVLAELASRSEVGVEQIPEVPGEEGLPRRTVVLASIDGQPIAAANTEELSSWLADQPALYQPAEITQQGSSLTLTYPVAAPRGLLPAGASD